MSKPQPIITAYCYQGGVIGFTTPVRRRTIPQGTLPICTGPAKLVKDIVSVCARHSYDGKTLLVPGLPEISLTKKDPLKVFQEWRKWVLEHPGLNTPNEGGLTNHRKRCVAVLNNANHCKPLPLP